jgi:hypothetical protein
MNKEIPEIIEQFNKSLKDEAAKDMKVPTVESIAEKIGIDAETLYRWIRTDEDFSGSLERLKDIQENDPFKTGDELDLIVDGSMIALLLIETKRKRVSKNE